MRGLTHRPVQRSQQLLHQRHLQRPVAAHCQEMVTQLPYLRRRQHRSICAAITCLGLALNAVATLRVLPVAVWRNLL